MLEWLFGKKKQEPQKKPKQSQKQTQEEDKWMYDFMIQFLMSPLWQITILDFVDTKCVVFDNEEENKFEYTIIHNEFKEMMGNLVDGMMEEIGMDQEKLAELIEKGLQSKQKKIFNQLLLADDFLNFKGFMLKRNKMLEEQAIKSLNESKLKQSSPGDKKDKKSNKQHDFEAQLLRQSQRMEDQRQKKLQQEEQEMLRKAIELSKIDSQEHEAIKALEEKAVDKVQEKPAEKPVQKSATQTTEEKVSSKVQPSSRLEPLKASTRSSQLNDLPPLKGSVHRPNPPKVVEQVSQPIRQKVEQVKPEVVQQPAQQAKPVQQTEPSQSLEDRKARLLAQREKIRKQKEQQRRKQLEQQASQKREKQAQPVVQTIVLQEEGFFDETSAKKEGVKPEGGVSEDELKRRKELMNKIKSRIIDDF